MRRFLLNKVAFGRPGSDLLSRVLRRSTMGAGAFHGRVRKGNGCSHPAITTRSAKRNFRLNLADLARFEKLVRLEVSFVLFEHVVGCVSGRSPQAQSASPEVWRAVRSIGSKTRTCVRTKLNADERLRSSDEHWQWERSSQSSY